MLLYIHLHRNVITLIPPLAFPASRFMAYHTSLTNSQEFTAALQTARELAYNITMGMRNISGTSSDFEVFPYTYVHVFPRLFLVSPNTLMLAVVSQHYFSSLLLPG